MNTLVLTAETGNLPIAHLLQQVGSGGTVELRNPEGNLVAVVMSPEDHEAWMYAEAHRDIDENLDRVRAALERRGGITTQELLAKARAAAEKHDSP